MLGSRRAACGDACRSRSAAAVAGVPLPLVRPAATWSSDGPYPLYQKDGEWLATRLSGLAPVEIDQRIVEEARVARAQRRPTVTGGPWLHNGCLFEVQRTARRSAGPELLWAYGRVVRCDEPVVNAIPEPQMGMRPREVRVVRRCVGYFPSACSSRTRATRPRRGRRRFLVLRSTRAAIGPHFDRSCVITRTERLT